MKKSLVALAALAVAGVASAQSSVTLFGVVDTAISGYSNKAKNVLGSVTTSQTALTSSGYNASRLGFRGTEDLGGGLAASFWLEAGLATDTGASNLGGGLQFNRRSTVSLSGTFGEIRLGRDYTPTFWNDTVFDPFGTNGVGTNLVENANDALSSTGYSRSSNSVGYFLPPNLGGFYGQFMYAFAEKTSYDPAGTTPPGLLNIIANPSLLSSDYDSRSGRYVGGRVGYATGPLDVALSYGSRTVDSGFYSGFTQNNNTWNLGGSYDFGVVKLFGEYSNTKYKTDWKNSFMAYGWRDPSMDGWLLGATVPVGAGLVRMSYSGVKIKNVSDWNTSDPKADQFALGYVYNLSKRTAVYATVAYLKNKNGADFKVGGPSFADSTPGGRALVPNTSTGYDLGLRHSF